MRFGTRVLPMVGLPAGRYNHTAARPATSDGGSAGPMAGAAVIDGRMGHRAALTVAKLPEPDWKDER